ncbi:hypothetical protein AGOR_G00118450 [Albula goreensis]|uniref:non-specific serine/threonine protein kinase n=1 Tax=Albula goreensis TaxID=1534307 RepID=A0A8T3DEY7_9TELE|nr:hypothetical protein AGOR_G00118450 [Albula goreensis]
MSLGVNNRDATKDLEEKICAFVMSKGEGAKLKAMEIAKGVGLTAAKDVNKTLYALRKAKRLQLLQSTTNNPPLWSLSGPTEPTTDEAANPNVTPSETRILSFLRSQRGEKGVTVLEICRKLKLERTPVNSQLYQMRKVGAVEVSESSPPEWKCTGDGISKNEKENSDSSLFKNQSETWGSSDSESSSTLQSAVSRIFSDFDVQTAEELGEGGFGTVHKVQQMFDKKNYAIKVVSFTEDSLREVKALANFDHPNIVRYYTTWKEEHHPFPRARHASSEATDLSENEDDQQCSSDNYNSLKTPKTYLCIQMEFCSEGTLRKWIDERNEKEEDICRDKALSIFQNIVDGVQYIHSKDQIHRDLKPDNILFGSDGAVKIGDFGLVTTIRSEHGASVYRTKGRGTRSYMSPEQENQSKYDEKVDIFSLGLILFELLWKLATGMERGKIWPDLRRGRFPENFCNQYTSEHTLITRMLSELPRRRPTATDIAKRLKVLLEGQNGERDMRTV